MRNLLLTWIAKQTPEEMLMAELNERWSTPLPSEQKSLGALQEIPPGIPECLAEEALLEAADKAYITSLASLQFAVMELIRCKSQGMIVGLSGEQTQSFKMMELLQTRIVKKAKTWKRQPKWPRLN